MFEKMFTENIYIIENQRRQDDIAQAKNYRLAQIAREGCESPVTTLSIRLLDSVGSKMVQWGQQLQCRCAEITMTNSRRGI
jgi:hypothetical protein